VFFPNAFPFCFGSDPFCYELRPRLSVLAVAPTLQVVCPELFSIPLGEWDTVPLRSPLRIRLSGSFSRSL